jgi:hypothetical protein
MSKFNNSSSSSYFKRNVYQFDIKTKSPKKNQKNNNNQKNNDNISDNDFNKLMEDSDYDYDKSLLNNNKLNNNKSNKNDIKLINYLSKIEDSEIVNKLIEEQLVGCDLMSRIESDNITGSQLLKGILNKYNDPNIYNWIELNQYGSSLQLLLKNDLKEQLLCLLMIQNYSNSFGFPKITYKNKQVYFIKIIFQLLFTYDIIDESTFWNWNDILIDIVDIDDETKKLLCIQTTEFFNILKMTFTEDDYENENNENNEINKNPNYELKLDNKLNNDINRDEGKDDEDDDSEKYKVPEEQDYFMDDDF